MDGLGRPRGMAVRSALPASIPKEEGLIGEGEDAGRCLSTLARNRAADVSTQKENFEARSQRDAVARALSCQLSAALRRMFSLHEAASWQANNMGKNVRSNGKISVRNIPPNLTGRSPFSRLIGDKGTKKTTRRLYLAETCVVNEILANGERSPVEFPSTRFIPGRSSECITSSNTLLRGPVRSFFPR